MTTYRLRAYDRYAETRVQRVYDRSWPIAGIDAIQLSDRCTTHGGHQGFRGPLQISVPSFSDGAWLTLTDPSPT
jgi:hypothetical protein